MYTLKKMLKQDLILQNMKLKDHYPEEEIKKVTELMKDKLGEKTVTEFVALLP